MENVDLKLQTTVTLLFSNAYSNPIFHKACVLQKHYLKNVDFRTMLSQTNLLKYSASTSPPTLAGAQHTQIKATCILLSNHRCRQSVYIARAENYEYSLTFFPCSNGCGGDGEKQNTPSILLLTCLLYSAIGSYTFQPLTGNFSLQLNAKRG